MDFSLMANAYSLCRFFLYSDFIIKCHEITVDVKCANKHESLSNLKNCSSLTTIRAEDCTFCIFIAYSGQAKLVQLQLNSSIAGQAPSCCSLVVFYSNEFTTQMFHDLGNITQTLR